MAVVLYSRVVDCYFCMGYVIHIDASNFEIKIKIANDYTFQYCFFFPQPFAVHGTLTPESNVSFDASLRQRFVMIILCVPGKTIICCFFKIYLTCKKSEQEFCFFLHDLIK